MDPNDYNFTADDLGNVIISKTEDGVYKNLCEIPVNVVNKLYDFLRLQHYLDEVNDYIGHYLEEVRLGDAFLPRGSTPSEVWEANQEIAEKYIEYADKLDITQCLYDAFEYVVGGLESSI